MPSVRGLGRYPSVEKVTAERKQKARHRHRADPIEKTGNGVAPTLMERWRTKLGKRRFGKRQRRGCGRKARGL